MPNGSKLHILSTNCHLLASQQEPYQKTNKKRLTLNEKYLSFLERKMSEECTSRKMTRQKEQEEIGRKTGHRKGESKDSPEIPDRGEGALIHPWPPFGVS